MLREACSSFVHQQLDEQRHNPRQLWCTVRALLHPGQRRNWYDGEDTDQYFTGWSVHISVKTYDDWCTTKFRTGASIIGPYTIYVSPRGRLIASHGVEYHQYADDIQIFTRMTVPFATAFDSLQGCVKSLQYWFWDNGLLLNPNKSAVAYFGTSRLLQCSLLHGHLQ